LVEKLLGSTPSQLKSTTTSTPLIETDSDDDDDAEQESGSNPLYVWFFESTDLAKLVIVIKSVQGVQYSTQRLNDHTVEVTAHGEITADELEHAAILLGVPTTMLRVRLPSWTKKLTINTVNSVTGKASIVGTIGNLKILTYPLVVLHEDAILTL
jgi:hypothetical protein